MATYVEDEEVSELIGKYANREGKTKTGALRDLLRRELNMRPKKSPEARFQDALSFVASHPTERTPLKKSDVNSLYEYLDDWEKGLRQKAVHCATAALLEN